MEHRHLPRRTLGLFNHHERVGCHEYRQQRRRSAATGSLAVSNVQILAFDPVNDPTPQNNTIDVTGGTYVILGDETAPITVTIQAGATAELDITASGASTYTGPVAFAATTGTLVLDQPGDFNGTISGISGSGDVIDLVGYDTGTTVTPGTYSGGDTILTVDNYRPGNLIDHLGRKLFGHHMAGHRRQPAIRVSISTTRRPPP